MHSNIRRGFTADTGAGDETAIAEAVGPFSVRPIEPSDAAAYRSVLDRTSEDDRYCRFFHVVNHFDLSDIAHFVDARADTFGLIAEDGPLALGVAHAFTVAPGSVELAIVVAGDARRRGVGRALLDRLIHVLVERRITTATALSLTENAPFALLARSVGMLAGEARGGVITWTIALPVR
jgi:GNAT superfamily N-acetyltransferase